MATGPGPVGFRHGSDSLSTIQGGADQLLADGEVRPFSPGYGPAANPGESLWVDPNAAPAGTSPFGLDDACVDEDYQDPNMAAPSGAFMLDDEWWKKVGLDGPITMEQVQGLTAALAAKVSLTAFNALVADFEQHLLDANEGGVTIEQVNAAINAALVSVLADITTLQGLVTALGVTVDGHTTLLSTHTAEIATLFSDLSTVSGNVSGLGSAVGTLIGDVSDLQTSVAGKQASSAELSILAGLTSTTTGRQLLTAANTAAVRTLLGIDLTDNSPDASKPVSVAQLAAINAAIATAAADATSKAGAAQAAAVAAASTDATTKANAAQAAAISAASTDATTKADAKVADAINDGTTTVAPSQNAVFDALALKADLASPALTGDPTAPTQAPGNNSTRLATTAYVQAEAVPKSTVTTKGDLIVGTGAGTVTRRAAGANGTMMVPDSTQTDGFKSTPIGVHNTPAASYYLPEGAHINYWYGAGALSSNAANSSQTIWEQIYDVGAPGFACSSITVWCQAANAGAGAAMVMALYEITGPLTRSLISSAGSVSITSTGSKTSTFTAVAVPRKFAVQFALINIDTAGANPTFGLVAASPSFAPHAADRIVHGNNAPNYKLGQYWAGGSSMAWPASPTMTDVTGQLLMATVGVA